MASGKCKSGNCWNIGNKPCCKYPDLVSLVAILVQHLWKMQHFYYSGIVFSFIYFECVGKTTTTTTKKSHLLPCNHDVKWRHLWPILVSVKIFSITCTCMSDIVGLICHNAPADLKQMALQQRSDILLSSVSLWGHKDAAGLHLIWVLSQIKLAAVVSVGCPWSTQTVAEPQVGNSSVKGF